MRFGQFSEDDYLGTFRQLGIFIIVVAALLTSGLPASAAGDPGGGSNGTNPTTQQAATPVPAPYPPQPGEAVKIMLPDDSGPAATVTIDSIIDPFEDYGNAPDPGDGRRYVAVTYTLALIGDQSLAAPQPVDGELRLGTPDGRVIPSADVRFELPETLPPESGRTLLGFDTVAEPGTQIFLVPDDVVVSGVFFHGYNRSASTGSPASTEGHDYAGYLTLLADLDWTTPRPTAGTAVAIRDDDGAVLADVTVTGVRDPFTAYLEPSGVTPRNRVVAFEVTVANQRQDEAFRVSATDFFVQTADGLLDDRYALSFAEGADGLPFLGGAIPPHGYASGIVTFLLPETAVLSGLYLRPQLPDESYAPAMVNVGSPGF